MFTLQIKNFFIECQSCIVILHFKDQSLLSPTSESVRCIFLNGKYLQSYMKSQLSYYRKNCSEKKVFFLFFNLINNELCWIKKICVFHEQRKKTMLFKINLQHNNVSIFMEELISCSSCVSLLQIRWLAEQKPQLMIIAQ